MEVSSHKTDNDNNAKPLVSKEYRMFATTEGKGAWTFVEIPEVAMPKTAFGMMKVKGKIDNYEFSNMHLMPLGNGHLGLPIKSGLRKMLKKQAPDTVHITLYEDRTPLLIPQELLLCMGYEKGAIEKFEQYSDGQKKALVDWIYSAKTEQTKANRIAKAILIVMNGEKLY